MPRAKLWLLQRELQARSILIRRLDGVCAMSNHHGDAVGLQAGCAIQHMREHWPARDLMQHLGQIGLHALAHAGSQNDNVQHSVVIGKRM